MVRVDTEQYEFANGKKPRGRGMWIFFLKGGPDGGYRTVDFIGGYGDAKQHAIKCAKARGATSIVVGA